MELHLTCALTVYPHGIFSNGVTEDELEGEMEPFKLRTVQNIDDETVAWFGTLDRNRA